MIENPRNWLSLSLAAALLLTAGAAIAQRGPGRFGPPGHGPGPGAGPAAGLLHGPLGDQLELTDEQREAIRGILEAQRQAARPWHEDLKSLEGELQKAIDAEPFDEETVRAVAQQMADIRVELAVARARVAQEVRAVLDPDQRETLGELRAQHRQFRGGRGYHRRGPGG